MVSFQHVGVPVFDARSIFKMASCNKISCLTHQHNKNNNFHHIHLRIYQCVYLLVCINIREMCVLTLRNMVFISKVLFGGSFCVIDHVFDQCILLYLVHPHWKSGWKTCLRRTDTHTTPPTPCCCDSAWLRDWQHRATPSCAGITLHRSQHTTQLRRVPTHVIISNHGLTWPLRTVHHRTDTHTQPTPPS